MPSRQDAPGGRGNLEILCIDTTLIWPRASCARAFDTKSSRSKTHAIGLAAPAVAPVPVDADRPSVMLLRWHRAYFLDAMSIDRRASRMRRDLYSVPAAPA